MPRSTIHRAASPRISSLLLVAALAAGASGCAHARDKPYLPPEVEDVVKRRKVPPASLSVYVREVGREEPLVSFNSDVPRNPASTMKLLTTYAALETLGPAYTWRTRAYAAGAVRDQVLEGDLVLVGGGDPFMIADRWWGFVNGLRQAGVQRIAGDVVIDNSYFAPQGDDRAAFDNRPYNSYNVLPDALLVNFQTVTINAVPDVATGTVRASVNPWPANFAIDSNVRLDPGPCRRGSGGISVAMPEGAMGARVVLGGRYAAGCGQFSTSRAVMKPPDYAFGLFKSFWQQAGGTIGGGLRLGPLPPDAKLLYTHDSLTLAEVIRLINKYSSNAMARSVYLTLAAERYPDRPATTDASREAIDDFLASREIAIPALVIENGSGLSRNERITAAGLADVLLAAWQSPYMPEFAASLPLSATDGTLKRRFRAPEMQGRLRMKTGSLTDVAALAGYVSAASGKTFVTVVMLNHPAASQGAGEALQTALVEWVFGQ
ncbi:MAG TPA: D-alanyl-D-alanine carboxypeptidase/D-alanyl-D-alanine-endopeptidase [Steroidobacteraceae bacterium]|nr:D-alanyl-D-alanine carboxypeptidase/D-alanyl-D-alanine-endopeptidase [Steroidobacteraceae bacterium]